MFLIFSCYSIGQQKFQSSNQQLKASLIFLVISEIGC